MTKQLLIQSIGVGHDGHEDTFAKYMALARPIHEDYARRCDADYLLFEGWKEAGVNPTWNRVIMIIDALAEGYRKVVWLDADTLVVKPDRNIFAETDDASPLLMTRTSGFPWWTPSGEQEAWNDGALVVNACAEAVESMRWLWDRRHDPFLSHQISGMPELSWLLDRVFQYPDLVAELPDIWNWMHEGVNGTPRDDAVIEAWHGQPHEVRWANFCEAYTRVYG